jgi:hypothetical protein
MGPLPGWTTITEIKETRLTHQELPLQNSSTSYLQAHLVTLNNGVRLVALLREEVATEERLSFQGVDVACVTPEPEKAGEERQNQSLL